jgi:hypothetical protein
VNTVDRWWLRLWLSWIKIDGKYQTHPRMFAVAHVPVSAWIIHPRDGYQSYRRIVNGLLTDTTNDAT